MNRIPSFPAPAPTGLESKAILAETRRLKLFAKARRLARFFELGLLPDCARAEAHLAADIDAAMSDEGFGCLVARLQERSLLAQMDADAECSEDELMARVRISNATLWAKYGIGPN